MENEHDKWVNEREKRKNENDEWFMKFEERKKERERERDERKKENEQRIIENEQTMKENDDWWKENDDWWKKQEFALLRNHIITAIYDLYDYFKLNDIINLDEKTVIKLKIHADSSNTCPSY